METTLHKGAYQWIPWAFAGCLLAVVAVNGVLGYFALESSTGLVTQHPFENGVEYNRVLEAAAAQDALGWQGRINLASDAEAHRLAAQVIDRAGRPLSGLSVIARLTRPIEPLPDVVVPLRETSSGVYLATTSLSRPGQWDVRIVARRDSAVFQFVQRIVVK
jgi:nitrogen fixation protein FixH